MARVWVYILKSERNGRYYIGQSANLAQRLAAHNAGHIKSTKYLRPWILVYTERHQSATAARKREWYLKRLKSRRALEKLMISVG